jgi:hypothetical protein
MLYKNRLIPALIASGVHLLSSLVVALVAAALVFFVWYPYPYRELSGGKELFLIVVAVDVVCGPLLTMVLFNNSKPRSELFKDLTLVVLIQLAALIYGMYTMALARPVYLVEEVDRFKVVSVADISPDQLKPESNSLHKLPWFGPQVIGTREPRDSDEKLKSLEMSLQGLEPSARPEWWQSYDLSRNKVLMRAKPVADLRAKRQGVGSLIDHAIKQSGKVEAELLWLPMTSFKSTDWVAFIDSKTAQPLAYAPIDGF